MACLVVKKGMKHLHAQIHLQAISVEQTILFILKAPENEKTLSKYYTKSIIE